MKKRLVIGIIILLLACTGSFAQNQFRKPLKTTNESILGFSNYNIGLKMGCPWSMMTKSDLQETTYNGHFGYLIGIAGERNLGKWSIGLEGTFAQKGAKMHNELPYQISLSQTGVLKTSFETAYNVIAVRVPVTYYFKGMVKEDLVVPYLFAGLQSDIPLGFNFDLWHFQMNNPSTSIIQQFDGPTGDNPLPVKEEPFYPGPNVSAVAGMGFMTQVRFENSAIIFKFDIAYNRGIWNLAVPTKDGWKWPFEQQDTKIFAHDVEANFSIVFPIKKILYDACYYFKK